MKHSALVVLALVVLFCSTVTTPVRAQKEQTPPPIPQVNPVPNAVAKRSDIYCTGYITESTLWPDSMIIGGERENFQNSFAQGDVVFLNKGRAEGVRSGAVYYIIRPLGEIKHPFHSKRKLGTYVREIGMLRVIQVNDKTSTAEVTISCDTVEMGDLLKPYEEKVAPEPREGQPLPLHGDSTGDVAGQIVLAQNGREYMAAHDIVFIDLGERQGVQVGDYFSIYHKIVNKRENIASYPQDKIYLKRSEDYHSDHWKGGTFSNQSLAKEREKILHDRPYIPRKVLGEMIVLKVEKGTAVALITRTTGEINIGDRVERN
ncbi:MAG: hypothetical protein HY231_00330 [Acidobacteria bacterium]|nr:hypothetical protein [Acidobacteriota bacterium]